MCAHTRFLPIRENGTKIIWRGCAILIYRLYYGAASQARPFIEMLNFV
jgi:hypothetical protein